METEAKTINYKCPNCAAPLTFSIESQKWVCHFCDSVFERSQIDQIESAEETKTVEEATWEAKVFEEDSIMAYTCPDCGGQVIAPKDTVATFCTYCHHPTVLASKLTGVYKPAKIIPFKVTKQQAMEKLTTILKKKPLLPRHFKKCVDNGEITGLYVPFWLFSGMSDSNLTAHGLRISRWSDSNYIYTKTDTYLVHRSGTIPFDSVPVDASSRLDDKLMDSLEPFNFSQIEDFTMQYLSGYLAENFDVNAADSQKRFFARAQNASRDILRRDVHGYNSVNILSFNANFKNVQNMYVFLPVWTISVKDGGKIYSYSVNGQTGKSVGRLPISYKRLFAYFAGIAGITTLLLYFILPLLERWL